MGTFSSIKKCHFLEKKIATHSSILAWKIPWTEEPGKLQSMGLQRVALNCATSKSHFLVNNGRANTFQNYKGIPKHLEFPQGVRRTKVLFLPETQFPEF